MQKTEVKCDYCRKDLTYSRGGYDYVLSLKNRRIGPNGDAVLAYMSIPSIDCDCDFCGTACLEKWLKNDMKPMETLAK